MLMFTVDSYSLFDFGFEKCLERLLLLFYLQEVFIIFMNYGYFCDRLCSSFNILISVTKKLLRRIMETRHVYRRVFALAQIEIIKIQASLKY